MRGARSTFRVAFVAWEPGRPNTGYGTKIGGLGAVMEELPQEIAAVAAARDIELDVEVLSPCFEHYDRSKLTKLPIKASAILKGESIPFDVYEKRVPYSFESPDGLVTKEIRLLFFHDDWQLNWTSERFIYPDDPWMGLKLYATLGQAFASYLNQSLVQSIHLHDYHVGFIPFYLSEETLDRVPVHLTIHNATYQGATPAAPGQGYRILSELNLSGEKLYHKYFDYFDKLNLMKAAMIRVHELGGKITTVSGNISASWGYAAELKQGREAVLAQAATQKGSTPWEIFLPNQALHTFEKIPIAGITNGLALDNWPQKLPSFSSSFLRRMQDRRGDLAPIFRNPTVQKEMLERDHSFDANDLANKVELKRLLHLEAFGHEPDWAKYPISLVTVGRLVQQKNLGIIAEVFPDVLAEFPETRLFVLASAGDSVGKFEEGLFFALRDRFPDRVYFSNEFNLPLSKLLMGGGDFALVPSRFEPCGLVDYEASLLGTVVIGRRTGGLAKVGSCAYLYDWLDIGDRAGERWAFTNKIREAFRVYYDRPETHGDMMRRAMAVDAGWRNSAGEYLDMFLFGHQMKQWKEARSNLRHSFMDAMDNIEYDRFCRFFAPALREYGDRYDWELREQLDQF